MTRIKVIGTVAAAMTLACGTTEPASGNGSSSETGEGSTSAPATAQTTTTAESTGVGEESGGSSEGADTTTTGSTDGDRSPGCEGGDPNAIPATVEIDGVDREYFFVIPDDYDPTRAYPLVFAWHARGTNGAIARVYYQVEEASEGNAIFVYPDGLPQETSGGETGWNLSPAGYDVLFFDELYAQATNNLCIDQSRVFSTGHSFGGFMSNFIGCVRGEFFRAIAPVAGGGPQGTCSGPMAAWIAHGTVDPTVPFAVGEASYDYWRTTNGCADEPVAVDPSPCVTHESCDAGVPLTWCEHNESMPLEGHHWPTWAGDAIWDFFAQF